MNPLHDAFKAGYAAGHDSGMNAMSDDPMRHNDSPDVDQAWAEYQAPADPAPKVSTIEAAAMLAKVLGVNPARITHVDAKSVTVSEAAPVPLLEDGLDLANIFTGLRVYGFDLDPEVAYDGRVIPPHWMLMLPMSAKELDGSTSIKDKIDQINAAVSHLSSLRESVASLTADNKQANDLLLQAYARIHEIAGERDALRKALQRLDSACQDLGAVALPKWDYRAPAYLEKEWDAVAEALVESSALTTPSPTKEPQATDEHPLARMHADLMAAPKTKDGSHG